MIKLNDRTQAAVNDVIAETCKKLTENINSYRNGDLCGADAKEIFEAIAILSGLIEYERLQKLPDEYTDCVSDTVLGRRNV